MNYPIILIVVAVFFALGLIFGWGLNDMWKEYKTNKERR